MSASNKKQLRKEQNAQAMTARQKQEQADAKQLKTLTVVFSVIIIAIVAAFLITNIWGSISRNGVIEKNTTALTIGNHKLNSVMMNYYFMDAVSTDYNNVYNTYGDYTANYFSLQGLDLSKPLNEQKHSAEEYETWADYYKAAAIENAKADYLLYDLAMADPDFTVPEDVQASVDATLSNLQLYAAFSGVDTSTYLRGMYGNGANEKNYREFALISATASAYYNDHMDSLTYDDAALRAYEKDRYNEYSAFNFQTYGVSYSAFLEGGTTGEDGKTTYSEEEKAAAREKAREAAELLAQATSVKSLDVAIGALSINADKEEKPTSTLNENVMFSALNEDYAKWLTEEGRKEGDTKVFPYTTKSTDADGKEVEVTNTYYVAMYLSTNENLEKLANVRHILVNFEGGTTDDQGNKTYSDEEKAAAKAEAEALLEQWKNGEATEESFIALVKEKTDDTASKETGGLYEEIHRDSNYVVNFRDWAVAEERKAGDIGVVESTYGYHVMFYVGDDELTYRDYMIRNELLSNDMESWHNGIMESATVTEGNFKYVALDLIYSPAN